MAIVAVSRYVDRATTMLELRPDSVGVLRVGSRPVDVRIDATVAARAARLPR